MKSRSFLVAVLLISSDLMAQEWPQWRGPNRDGVAGQLAIPAVWPEQLRLQWKVEVGEGHSSPLVAGNRVYVHTRQGEDELVTCLSLSDGRILWRSQPYSVPYTMNSAAIGHGKGPKSTPALSDGRLFTLSINGILSAWDAAGGELMWRRDFSTEFDETSPLYGTSVSPLVRDGRVIAHVGGHDSGALRAFSTETGADIWSWNGDGPGYASPLLVEADGVRQVVTQTQQKIVGVAFSDGSLLWEIPFETPWVQNIVTPLTYGDLLIFSGLQNETFAVRLHREREAWFPEKVWSNRRFALYMSSPVLSGSLLFGMAHQRRGVYFCMDAKTGEVLWSSQGREGDNVAIIRSGDLLFFLKNTAELLVIQASGEQYRELAQYSVADSPTWAHPAPTGSQVLVKDRTALLSWTWSNEH